MLPVAPGVPPALPRSRPSEGLPGLRRSGSVTELLFLYECATREPTQLRPMADRLGLTVQAASHSFRQLRRRGLVEVRDGRYRPTVEGVAWLHEGLAGIADDVRDRLSHLHVIRSTRALAEARIAAGSPVSLELVDGLLSARPGTSGDSHGLARTEARPGDLVEVEKLEGIVPIEPARISVRTIREEEIDDPKTPGRIRRAIPGPSAFVAAEGLEPYLLVRKAWDGPTVRFAVARASAEAARVGVPATVFVLERDLPRLLASWGDARSPSFDVRPIGRDGPSDRSSRDRTETIAELGRRRERRGAPRE